MGQSLLRVGKVSSVDYESGMMRVVYMDKGKAVTKEMPYMNYNDEYSMPEVGTRVLTAHLSNGNSRGVVIGPMWNKANKPAESGKGIFRKEMSKTKGAAYTRYSDDSGEYLIQVPAIKIIGINGAKFETPEIEVEASVSIKINGKKMELKIDELEFEGEKLILKATEDITVESDENIGIKASQNMELEDSNWKTTLDKIMNRLAALDGNRSDRK